jgi:dihydroorotase
MPVASLRPARRLVVAERAFSGSLELGAEVSELDLTRAWLVDPVSGLEGPGQIVVRAGLLEAVEWLEGEDADGVEPDGIVVAPGFIDLHTHLREPGGEDAETIATGLAAAAHGGFTTVCAMPNTEPTVDEPSVLGRVHHAALASGSPVRLLAYGAVTRGRAGEQLAALGELADAGVVGFSDDGSPVRTGSLLRNALAYAGALGLPIVEHAEDRSMTEGSEAAEGLIATVLGLKGWPVSAEVAAVSRDLAVLRDVLRDVPGARLHLTHLSTAAGLDLVRAAKADGLPVTCDVTPHHLAFTDEWVAGARRWSWAAKGAGDPWRSGAIVAEPYDPACRVNPPLRAVDDAVACLAALMDGTADAVATDHAPHTQVDKEVEFGLAVNGISGIEMALGILLAAVDAGHLPLAAAIAALTTGPAAVLGARCGRPVGLVEGAPADLVVIDRAASWRVGPDTLLSKGHNSPLLGAQLPGRVLLTIGAGRLAWADELEG